MKKTIIALMALAGVATAAEINLLDTKYFTLCDNNQDVLDGDGISTSQLFGYGDINTWHCTYQKKDLDNQSTVTVDNGLSLQLGNVADVGGGNYAAVRFEAEAPITLSFNVKFGSAWGGDGSAFTADYQCSLYGFDSNGTATLIDSWNKQFARTTVKNYAGETVTLNFSTETEYATYGVIFSSTKAVSAAGGMNMLFSNIVATTAPVPEPATATLSLLALAGLAARRRRK